MNRLSTRVTALFLTTLLAGCGGGDMKDADPKLVPVSGQVSYKGQPLPDGAITFIGDNDRAFTSRISSGSYTLMESISATGAIPGEYKVTVTRVEAPPSGGGAPDPAKGKDQALAKPKSLIPEKYSNKNETDLKATVPAGGKTIDFELKD